MKTVIRRGLFPTSAEELKWDVRQRLAMLEATVQWEGRVTTAALTGLFGISRGQASRDFGVYQQIAPENLLYDLNLKAYRATDRFVPRFIRGTAEEFLLLAGARGTLGHSVVLPIAPLNGAVEVLRPPTPVPDLDVLRVVHGAIRAEERLAGCWRPEAGDATSIQFEPHALVCNGFRWHVRAWLVGQDAFGDILLDRLAGAPRVVGAAGHAPIADADWQQWETLFIAPDPRLPKQRQAVVAEDYGMEEGRLALTVRRALVPHVLAMLHLNQRETESTPVVLAGREAVPPPSTGNGRGS